MSRQSTSKRMFGIVMITVALLLVACGNGDGDSDPTATSEVNSAAPTAPTSDGTAEVEATEDISEDDLTVVEPDIPAATATAEEEVDVAAVSSPLPSTPAAGVTVATTPEQVASTPGEGPTDLTGSPDDAASSPEAVPATVEVPVTDATAEVAGVSEEPAVDATAEVAGVAEEGQPSTPAAVAPEPPATAESTVATPPASPEAADTPSSTPTAGHFNTPGDGTGGSGQPGERSSNVPGETEVVASPIAGIAVVGSEVPNVPEFEDDVVDYITVAEVNFRSGPGTECDPIIDEPLGEGVEVVVIGGPVTQSTDNTIWLQVEVDDVPGWVSEEFIEPAG